MLGISGLLIPTLQDMKRRHLNRAQADSAGVMDISSLVDICFLLLIYFLVTSVITPPERDLPMGAPGDRPDGPPVQIEPMTVSINASGEIFSVESSQMMPLDADSSVRRLPLLEDRLKFYQQAVEAMGEKCLVIIEAHDEVKTQRVVDVLNTLAGLEISNVSFKDPVDQN